MIDKWEVITMKGECEPWWFFKNWQESIIENRSFEDRASAITYYHERYMKLNTKYQHVKVKKSTMAAFWNEGEYVFCTSCDDDLQLYCGLLLFKNGEPFSDITLSVQGEETDNE
ncbi:DUF1033 family protein [Bacillus sp. FSL K6-3431]|uniref:DUF1033 family protein n=1 Tax=Bacillus sp. FSL K6-3431 TaxID=2921500 RepID=UPI0030F510EC